MLIYIYSYSLFIFLHIDTRTDWIGLDWIGLDWSRCCQRWRGQDRHFSCSPEALEVARHGKQKHWDLDGEVGPNSCWFDGDLIIFLKRNMVNNQEKSMTHGEKT